MGRESLGVGYIVQEGRMRFPRWLPRALAELALLFIILFFGFNAIDDKLSAQVSELDGPTWEELQSWKK